MRCLMCRLVCRSCPSGGRSGDAAAIAFNDCRKPVWKLVILYFIIMLVIILTTTILSNTDQKVIRSAMDKLAGPGNWSVDLGDVDKVLRVQLNCSMLLGLLHLLDRYQFEYQVLNIYDSFLGIDYPLLMEENQ